MSIEQADKYYNLGIAERSLGNYRAAINWLEMAVDCAPDFIQAYLALGVTYQSLNNLAEAEYCFRLVLHKDQEVVDALLLLGQLCRAKRAHEEAVELLEKAVFRKPDSAEAHMALACMYSELGRVDSGIESWLKVIKLNKGDSSAYNNLGLLYHIGKGDLETARYYFLRAVQTDPDFVEARLNLSLLMADAGDLAGSVESLGTLLSSPLREEAFWCMSVGLLKHGRFSQGWSYYSYRWGREGLPKRHFPYPTWDGSRLNGKSLLVYAEQGLGDEIMFSSCMHDLIDRASGRIVLECSPRLEKLFARSFPEVSVIGAERSLINHSWLPAVEPIDYKLAAGDMPSLFRNSLADFPKRKGYLEVSPERSLYWRNQLVKIGPGFKVGISWRGGLPRTRRDLRSIALVDWLPILAVPGIQFVSLQYDECISELQELRREHGVNIFHWQEAIADYDETAALVSNLDQVVTVCTAVVHLAGALGKPTWVLVPRVPEWRYGIEGDAMPWYPSARLFRQTRSCGWSDVIEEISQLLRGEVQNRSVR